jgi:hypothetical protein
MAEKLGNLECCKGNKDFLLTKTENIAGVNKNAPYNNIGKHLKLNEKGNHFSKGDTINKAIKKIGEASKGPKVAEDLCEIYNTLVDIIKKSVWFDTDISSYVEKLKTACDNNVVKPKSAKEKCKKKLGSDYDDEVKKCSERKSGGELVRWSDSNCGCVADDKGVVAPIEEIKGCMDPDAVNYNSEATVKSRCEFEKEVELENEFCFCVTDDCGDIGRCIKGTQIIKGYATSKAKFDRTYDAIYERALEVIASLNQTYPDFRISTEKGFYGEDVDSSYIEDLAKALTILEYRGYSLSSASKGDRKKSDMLMKSPGGEYLGFFSGASMSAPLFDDFNIQFSPNVIRKRISTNLGGSIPKKYINGIKKYINNIPFDIDSEGTIVNTINEGLISVLRKEPIGLAKLLK